MMSEKKENNQNTNLISTDLVSIYYQRQYVRMDHHEYQRLTLSNVVITLTVLGFTFGFADSAKLNLQTGIGLPLVIIVANVFAIVFARGSHAICLVHQKRAHDILKKYAQQLYSVNKEIELPKLKLNSFTRTLIGLHILLIVASLLPIITYLVSIQGK